MLPSEPDVAVERRVPTAADVRTWARNHDWQVGTRGHLSAELIKAFNRSTRERFFPFESKNPMVTKSSGDDAGEG